MWAIATNGCSHLRGQVSFTLPENMKMGSVHQRSAGGTFQRGTSSLLLENDWQGTIDISSILAVQDAIDFLNKKPMVRNGSSSFPSTHIRI